MKPPVNMPGHNRVDEHLCAKSQGKKLYIKTHGCQMNEYDSSRMVDLLKATHQVQVTDNPEEADILLLNTCSIREKAHEKVFSEIGRWKEIKENNQHVVIGVGGCVASLEGQALRKRAPYVDMVFGPQTLHRLPQMLSQVKRDGKPVVDVQFPEIEKFDCLPPPGAKGPTAFISIMEGCNKYCSYCIVPYTRGEEISRPLDDVIVEAVALVDQNVREIHLLGQNVNDYQGKMHDGQIADLARLIELLAAIEGVQRIRFTTSHPSSFGEALIQTYAKTPKLVNHLHLPVQSGSNRVLAMMKRDYTAQDYLSKMQALRKVRPDISISSDFIVGFPNESDSDFADTMNLINAIRFDNSFSFIYSPRPGTPASQYPDNIPMEVKKQRLQILQNRILQLTRDISESMIGSEQAILVEKFSKKDSQQLSGRTENNRVVNFDGPSDLIGQVIRVKITEALPNSLRGKIC